LPRFLVQARETGAGDFQPCLLAAIACQTLGGPTPISERFSLPVRPTKMDVTELAGKFRVPLGQEWQATPRGPFGSRGAALPETGHCPAFGSLTVAPKEAGVGLTKPRQRRAQRTVRLRGDDLSEKNLALEKRSLLWEFAVRDAVKPGLPTTNGRSHLAKTAVENLPGKKPCDNAVGLRPGIARRGRQSKPANVAFAEEDAAEQKAE